MTLVIGLTGSIATGKSTVSQMFRERGIPVIDADRLAREVVEPGQPAYTSIVDAFGEGILQPDQTLDRKKLGEIVFNDKEKRKKLNSFVHPEVRKEMLRQRDSYKRVGEPAVVLDIPLLFESKLTDYVDTVVVVSVDEGTQLRRLMERDGSSKEEALQRIRAQMPISEKVGLANDVVDNSGTRRETSEQVEGLLRKWNIV